MFPVISKEGLAVQLGITPGVIDGWMKRHLQRGRHYVVKGHQTLFYIEEMQSWLSGLRESDRVETELRFESGDTDALSTRKMYRATRTKRLTLLPQSSDARSL
jgi:hypothetical protein